ncbi:hypothetical protein HPP92_015826 [Vanilla planifolia]|uniref:Uncharacterized protein n=1 Tax=Vanilla planifolia TaxID=51239 RepID=A0A835USS1_VANPL|nr:hypothetical protein HPP92_015826 [Vanilla planifolia]
MEVMVRRSPDFQFDTVVNSPYATAPSSPRFFGDPFDERFHYTSVPTSPTRAAAIFSHLSDETGGGDLLDFAFDYGKQSGSVELPEISTADELFEKGRIRLLQPPPPAGSSHPGGERGRQRTSPVSGSGSKSRARESRSLSPLRNHGFFAKADSSTAGVKDGGGSRKWSLKDLLLFRSASEGRATGRSSKDLLQKYTLFSANKKKGGTIQEWELPVNGKRWWVFEKSRLVCRVGTRDTLHSE